MGFGFSHEMKVFRLEVRVRMLVSSFGYVSGFKNFT
jgi:hypothetical protein